MKEEQFDYRMLLAVLFKYWYIFAAILPLFLVGAYLYLKIKSPVYESSALLLIKEDERSGQLNEATLFKELGLGNAKKNLQNEKSILASTPLMLEVVKNLNLQYQYIEINPLQNIDMYPGAPVQVAEWSSKEPGTYLYGELELDGKGGYVLTVEEEDEVERRYVGEFGKTLILPSGKLTLTLLGGQSIAGRLGIRITPAWARAKELISNLAVEMMDEQSSILMISYKDVSGQRAHDVVKELIDMYNHRSIDLENQVFKNTINLINERIELINEELTEAEMEVADYKQRFGMVELSAEGNLLMTEMADHNKEIKETEVQLAILESIEDYLIRNKDSFEFIPTNISLSNPTVLAQLESFNRLLAEKQRNEKDFGPDHPDLLLVERQIKNLRETIIENIESMRGDLLIARNANVELKDNLESRLRSLPSRERELIEIERRKNVKENLYLYLLEKREESAISMAITMAKGEVVEMPEVPYTPVSPKPAQIWLIAGFLGLAIPSGLAFLLLQLNDKIQTEEDLEQYTSLPVAGSLAQSSKNKTLVVKENSRTASAEMFRMLRANLAYISPGKELKTLLITSTTAGEGKSFVAVNLGMAQAMSGKRVILLEMDLRKPKDQTSSANIEKGETGMGIVNYLVDPKVEVHQIIRESGFHDQFDVISCGPKPPNPSELILSSRLRNLIDELRALYDFILIDSPPVGIVADALQMKDMVDGALLVVRAGFTPKAHLKVINKIAEKNKLPRPFLVLNGIKLNGMGYNYSSYAGGYAYIKKSGYFEKEA